MQPVTLVTSEKIESHEHPTMQILRLRSRHASNIHVDLEKRTIKTQIKINSNQFYKD